MQGLPNHLRELYFTPQHEWIRFEGSVATIGLTAFKLTGYKKISAHFLMETEGIIEAGTRLASFEYGDYMVDLEMPVTGKLLQWNDNMLLEPASVMLESINRFTWIARIIPAAAYDRKGLLPASQYKPFLKTAW